MAGNDPTVWHSMFAYKDSDGHVRTARRGAPATGISAEARKRGERLGAFDPPERQGVRDESLVATLPPIGDVQPLDHDADGATKPAPQPPGPDAVDSTEPSQAEGTGRPAQTAPKDAWVTFAVSQGMDRDEAEATNKADLIAALKG